jgi:hypothetical protein
MLKKHQTEIQEVLEQPFKWNQRVKSGKSNKKVQSVSKVPGEMTQLALVISRKDKMSRQKPNHVRSQCREKDFVPCL